MGIHENPTDKNEMLSLYGEFSLRDFIVKLSEWITYLQQKSYIIIIASIVGMFLGITVAYFKKPVYNAKFTFALEEEKSPGTGLTGALGLASSLGIDIAGGAGGAFSGTNLVELMRSRLIIERALMNVMDTGGVAKTKKTLAHFFLEHQILNDPGLTKDNQRYKDVFVAGLPKSKFGFLQDSLMLEMFTAINEDDNLFKVFQKDKKISILTIEVNSKYEFFAKRFAESIAKEVSDFYIDTKSKKAKNNLEILQKQCDSIRNELNQAIMGVAIANDNTFNLNQALITPRVVSTKKQIDVQANTAILTQLVGNLELAKISLRKETPLIQVIDTPILPLPKEKLGKLKAGILGGFLSGLFSVLFLVFMKCRKNYLRNIH